MNVERLRVSLRDILVVATFHLGRVRRTKVAFAQIAIFVLASTVSAAISHGILASVEKAAAMSTGSAAPEKPGAMYESFVHGAEFAEMIPSGLRVGSFVEWATNVPYMPLTWFFSSMIMVPFLAVAMGWGAIASDISGRTLRFEAIRAGRTEIFIGRFFGMSFLLILGLALGALVPLYFSQAMMVEQAVHEQILYFFNFIPRIWAWSLPFLAIGVTCSSIVSNNNTARVLSITLVMSSWWMYSLANDTFALLFPQAWVGGLYGGGVDWLGSAIWLLAISIMLLVPGIVWLNRRDI